MSQKTCLAPSFGEEFLFRMYLRRTEHRSGLIDKESLSGGMHEMMDSIPGMTRTGFFIFCKLYIAIKQMKKLFLFAVAAVALAACTDEYYEENNFVVCPDESTGCPEAHIETVSFEASEGLRDIAGQPVMVGDANVSGGFAGGVYPNVFWFESVAGYEEMLDPDMGNFDGPFFSTANENIWFGTAYMTSEDYGDSWGGFAVTADFGAEMPETGYPQFTVRTDRGACGSATCLIGYDMSYMGAYGAPTIDLVKQPRKACHLYMANTLLTYVYEPSAVAPEEYYYKVVIVGSLEGEETGRVECTLANGTGRVSDWVKVDLTPLGKVDRLKFMPDSNDKNGWGILAPAYFAVDEIGFIAE